MTRDPDWRRDLDARRGAPGPAHPLVLAVVQFLIHVLNPHPIRRRLYPVQRWALLNHYQHECGGRP